MSLYYVFTVIESHDGQQPKNLSEANEKNFSGCLQKEVFFDTFTKKEIFWYKNGKLHRDNDLAAYFRFNEGQLTEQEWYKEGELHRDNNMIARDWYDLKQWIVHGKLHRTDGPAEIEIHHTKDSIEEYKTWYIDDTEYSIEEYWNHPTVVEYKLNEILGKK